jgi:cytochrome b subunit of formate dehydrogenase
MKNSQLAGSQDDRAGTARMRRWSEEKLSVRLLLVAFVLVLTGALVWDGWFASASQNATWSWVLMAITIAVPAVVVARLSRSR